MLRPRLALLAVCLLALAGCGAKGTPVKGKLVLPSGVTLLPDDSVTVLFSSETEKGTSAPSMFNASDGTFVCNGPEGKGLVPGKYKIAVTILPYAGMDNDKRKAVLEPYNEAYRLDKTSLTYEVTKDADQSITIDLAQAKVSKP